MLDSALANAGVIEHGLQKSDFPVFQRFPNLHYLDSAATTQKPRSVIDAIATCYEQHCAPVHRGLYHLGADASVLFEQARSDVARFINAPAPQQCVFTRSATESINLVAQGWARQHLREADEVWISEMEHHANYLPWERVCRETGAQLRVVKLSRDGNLLIDEASLFGGKVKLIALTHVSNVLGRINPVASIAKRANEHGIPVLVDACQSVGHMPVDVQKLDCAFMVFSAHKMYGPEGIGVLYGKSEFLEQCEPLLLGGGMVDRVSCDAVTGEERLDSVWASLPSRLEAGSPNLSAAVGLSAAITLLERVGLDRLMAHSSTLAQQARCHLRSVEGVSLVGDNVDADQSTDTHVGIVSFVIDGIHPHDVAQVAADNDVAIRAGHHCAQPLMRSLGLNSTLRASFGAYNTHTDVLALVDAVKIALSVFRR